MKHLLQALLRWRESRVAWKTEAQVCDGPLDAVLLPTLELESSKKHNDLLLRCVQPRAMMPVVYSEGLCESQLQLTRDASSKSGSSDHQDVQSTIGSSAESPDLLQELAQ